MTPQDFCINVTFLNGCYHGEEWPPSAARLYQALVAGVMTCGYGEYAGYVEPALRWLERQPAPQIRCCTAEPRRSYRIAVPNNDMDVVAWEWVCGRNGDPAKLRTMKSVRPRDVGGDGPHVQYVWQVDATEANGLRERLQVAARCVHTLGWGVDMAFADVAAPVGSTEVYNPATSGDAFAVPMDGTLDDLRATYERFRERVRGRGADTDTRPSMLRMQPYRRQGELARPWAGFGLMSPDGAEPKTVSWEQCMKVAGWLRHAAAAELRSEFDGSFIEEYVQGHTQPDEKARRVSYVPMPTIYKGYGAGAIRRVAIVEPPDSAGDVVELLKLKLSGRIVTDSEGKPACSLQPAAGDDWALHQYGMRRFARIWRSVTPVILHGFNSDHRRRISLSKTERLLFRAFEMGGYPKESIEGFAFQSGPLWESTKHSAAMRVPAHLNGYPRLHVEVRFRGPVRGPVLAGIGQHYGIGLFAAVEGD